MKIDNTLIQACIKQNRRAQFELYKLCYSTLMSVCCRYKSNKEDAEEILNIGFLKILNSMDKYQDKVPFIAWIRRIMINTIIDEYRKSKNERENMEYMDINESKYSNTEYEGNTADLELDATDLLKMLDNLPDMSKKVFNLYAIDGYSHKEISEMLNISVGTSKWHVSFSRTELKKIIEKSKVKSRIE